VQATGTITEVPGGIDAWIARTTNNPVGVAMPNGGNTTVAPNVTLGRQLRDAEKDIARLERRRAVISKKIVDSPDHAEQTKLGSELAGLLNELNAAEERWLGLVD